MFELVKKQKHLDAILKIAIGVVIYCILILLLVYFEKDSEQSNIDSYSNAIWYSLVTLTTVGYGDIFPSTIYGRMIGYIFLFLSLGIYGILIGQFTTLMATLKENKRLGYSGSNFTNHAVIIGWNEFGKLVTDQLVGVGKEVSIVTNNKDDVDLIKEKYKSRNIYTLFTDFNNYDMLKKAGIQECSIVFINLEDDTEKLVYVLNLKKFFNDLEFVVTLENGDLKNTFLSAGVSNALSSHEISSKLLASYMFEPDVASYSESIMSFAKSDSDYDVKQFIVANTNPYLGKPYQEVFFDLKKRYNSILIGITKRDKYGKRKLIKNPLGDVKVALGDYLIIILNGKAFKLLKKVFNVEEGYFRDRIN
jgi:voltage-gated potassium channel